MKEYWVNVYYYGAIGFSYPSRELANFYKDRADKATPVLYRIHVKIKPTLNEIITDYDSFFKNNSKIIKNNY